MSCWLTALQRASGWRGGAPPALSSSLESFWMLTHTTSLVAAHLRCRIFPWKWPHRAHAGRKGRVSRAPALGDPCAPSKSTSLTVGHVGKLRVLKRHATSRPDVLEMNLRRYFQLSPSYTSHDVRAKPRTRRSPRLDLEPRPRDRAERRTHSATGCCTDVRRGTCDHDHTVNDRTWFRAMVTRTCSVQSALQHECRIVFLVHVQRVKA